MALTSSYELIMQLKEAKKDLGFSYDKILREMEKRRLYISMSTLRRVFKKDSELKASSFSYEQTLLPIAAVLIPDEYYMAGPGPEVEEEIASLKEVVHAKDEEIATLHDFKEHLEASVNFLTAQIDELNKIIKRLLEIKQ